MGATYAEMLGEFGVIGAAHALFLIFRNLGETFLWPSYAVYIPIIVVPFYMACIASRSVVR